MGFRTKDEVVYSRVTGNTRGEISQADGRKRIQKFV